MNTLDAAFERAIGELDANLQSPSPRPLEELRRRQRRRQRRVATGAALVAIAVVVGLVALADRTPPPDGPARAGAGSPSPTTSPTTSPQRVKIGTDLFPQGYGWLDARNFDQPSAIGPFEVFASEDATQPAYWYYKGMDIVPIGTPYDPTKTGETASSESSTG